MIRLEVTFGAPTSGKSSWCALAASGEVVSADGVRLLGTPGIVALREAYGRARSLLELGGRVTVDGCSLNARTRAMWLDLAAAVDTGARLVTFAVEPDDAMRRNARRPPGERVPWPLLAGYLRAYDEELEAARLEPWAEIVSGDQLRASAAEW